MTVKDAVRDLVLREGLAAVLGALASYAATSGATAPSADAESWQAIVDLVVCAADVAKTKGLG